MPINGVVTLPPALPVVSAMPPFTVSDIRKRTHAIQEVMKGVMKEGTHFGTIPGTPKPSLWKAGAEVLCMTFRLAPLLESHVTIDDPEIEWSYSGKRRDGAIVTGICTGYFEIEAACTVQGPGGEVLSRCSARCNNREGKYRSLPLFDIRNTIQKMAEKRAFVSAMLMATGASDIFTQDIEDFPELSGDHPAVKPERTEGIVLEPNEPNETKPENNSQQGLTPKREAWLMRVAHEGNVPEENMQRCMAFLRGADSKKVSAFFDDLAKRKNQALAQFYVPI